MTCCAWTGQAPTISEGRGGKPRGSQRGQVSVQSQNSILHLAGYKTLVGFGPSLVGGRDRWTG
jgi:hypothetical protein